ncbi:MAG TPA: ADP-ribosylglycohydrolase family protein [Syntrophorhabdales bacterium]|nr:ADP-ribosylglycohydrolase family protein [Syntrophorhabdales bacterium]
MLPVCVPEWCGGELMVGAIAGDIIGSVYEHHNIRTTDFPLFGARCTFTDDTVLTVAIADAILSGADYGDKLKEYFRSYPNRGYGLSFREWAPSDSKSPGYSMGNGSAMRVSPVGFAFDTLDHVLEEAKRSAEPSHSHPEGIKGAQATASAIYLTRTGATKQEIKTYIEQHFGYALDEPLDSIRKWYRFDVTCPGSVPQAIRAFLESCDFEDAIRKAISIGGDSDTIACITGGIAQAFYGSVPQEIIAGTLARLDDRLRNVTLQFMRTFLSYQ